MNNERRHKIHKIYSRKNYANLNLKTVFPRRSLVAASDNAKDKKKSK